MSPETTIAIVALAVSLIALLIAFMQLSTQLIGTAEGYRKCAPSVIGPWSTLRRRVLVWSELRYEVSYLTPHMSIIPAKDSVRSQLEPFIGPTWFLAIQEQEEIPMRPLDKAIQTVQTLCLDFIIYFTGMVGISINPGPHEMEQVLCKTAILKDRDLNWISATKVPSQSSGGVYHGDVEKQNRHLSQPIPNQRSGINANRDILASWLALIRALNTTYNQLSPCVDLMIGANERLGADGAELNPEPKAALQVNSRESGKVEKNDSDTHALRDEQPTQTHVAVAVRRWKWEFMPPDLMKPLATSTLNSIILMGLRLNMRWRRLDTETSVCLAEGNGYSLDSFEIRGLGIGFRFAVRGLQKVERECVPSTAVDKMMFGIIPGSETPAVGLDYNLVVSGRVDYEHFLSQLAFGDPNRRKQVATRYFQPTNEMITLLCPFLPIRTSTTFLHLFPGWKGGAKSCLHVWESRSALLVMLRKRAKEVPADSIISKTLHRVQHHLDHLEKAYWDDFYNQWGSSLLYDPPMTDAPGRYASVLGERRKKRLAFHNDLHSLFDWTTKYLKGESEETDWDWAGPDDRGMTRYADLVRAHGTMSHHAVHDVLENLDKRRSEIGDMKKYKEEWSVPVNIKHFDLMMHLLARRYVDRLFDSPWSLNKYYRERRPARHNSELEAVWWVMMLRGIIWDMSTQGDPSATKTPPRWEGMPVSCDFYNMETPVWIM